MVVEPPILRILIRPAGAGAVVVTSEVWGGITVAAAIEGDSVVPAGGLAGVPAQPADSSAQASNAARHTAITAVFFGGICLHQCELQAHNISLCTYSLVVRPAFGSDRGAGPGGGSGGQERGTGAIFFTCEKQDTNVQVFRGKPAVKIFAI